MLGRGLERRGILSDDIDKEDFLDRLSLGLSETGSQCLSWALMSNHYHLLIRVGSLPLSKLMRKVLSGYATQYNRRHNRVGYVFQNRFKSILCSEKEYFLELVRYIHLNPVRAKMITLEQLDRYNWTGHSVIMNNVNRPWQEKNDVLATFGQKNGVAIDRYQYFIREGITSLGKIDFSGGGLVRSYGGWENIIKLRRDHEMRVGDERILGDSDFVEQCLKEDDIKIMLQSRMENEGWTLEELIKRVCDKYDLASYEIMSKGRDNTISKVKSLVCYWGRRKLGLTATTLAIRLKISTTAVGKAAKKGGEQEQLSGLRFEDL